MRENMGNDKKRDHAANMIPLGLSDTLESHPSAHHYIRIDGALKAFSVNSIYNPTGLSRSLLRFTKERPEEMYSNTKLNINEARVMSKYQTRKGVIFESELKYYMTLYKIGSKEALRARTTVGSNKTMIKYFDDPESMPIGKLTEIMSALKIPKDERMKIVAKLIEN